MKIIAAALLIVVAAWGEAFADWTPPEGPDREARLMAASQEEGGELLWYSSLDVDDAILPLLRGFQAKYGWVKPGYRSEDRDALRTSWTQDAGSGIASVIDADVHTMRSLQRTLKPLKASEQSSELWAALFRQTYVVAYNSDLVSRADVPRSYEDLLDPKWTGRLGISASQDGGPAWLGAMLATRGDRDGWDYLTRLAGQNLRSFDASPRAVLDLVAMG